MIEVPLLMFTTLADKSLNMRLLSSPPYRSLVRLQLGVKLSLYCLDSELITKSDSLASSRGSGDLTWNSKG